VEAYTDRTLKAMLRRMNRHIFWPGALARQSISEYFEHHYGIPDCVGLIDGYHVNLAAAPSRPDAGAFHSRKERYGFNVGGIVDNFKRIRYLHVGYPASASDMRVQRAIQPLNDPHDHFTDDQYLLGDSGFAAAHHLVPMFKKTAGNALLRGRRAYFNMRAAPMRVKVEMAFGIMKGRWRILKSMPLTLRTKRDQARAHAMIIAAAMLHNLLVNTDTRWHRSDEDEDDDEDDGRQGINMDDYRVTENHRRREALVDQMVRLEGLTADEVDRMTLS